MAHTTRPARQRRGSVAGTTPAADGHPTSRTFRQRRGSTLDVTGTGHVAPRRRRRFGAGLAAALVALAPSGAHAVASLPDDVAEWFAHSAATTVSVLRRDALDRVGDPPDEADVAVTEPRPLYQWSEGFRTGEPTDEPVVAVDEWAAVFTSGRHPAGVVVAWRIEGEVELAYTEEDAGLALTLAELPAAALVVHEPMLGAHFAVEDGTVRTLRASMFPPTGPLPLEEFQPVLAQQVAQMGVTEEPVTESRSWVPVLWVALGGLVVAGLLLALTAARRRTGPGHT